LYRIMTIVFKTQIVSPDLSKCIDQHPGSIKKTVFLPYLRFPIIFLFLDWYNKKVILHSHLRLVKGELYTRIVINDIKRHAQLVPTLTSYKGLQTIFPINHIPT
jgi:hypothetical protein